MLSLAVSAVLLCAVALVNGAPIIYPDSALYIGDGERVLHLTAPLAVRPVFYGVAIWFLHLGRTVWPVLIVQGLVVAHIISLTLRVVGARMSQLAFILLILALALLTPLSWHTSHVLPDIFAGPLILALFLLGFCRDRLTRGESIYLFLLAAASISFHLTNLVIALSLFLATSVVWLIWRSMRPTLRPALTGGPIALALLAFFSFSLVLYHRLTLTPNSPPHLMARLIMDGPGRDYLRATCPASPLTICKYLDSIPDNYEGFLWIFMNSVPSEDGKRIRAEQGDVVRGTVLADPAGVAWHMAANTVMQLVTIESRTDFNQTYWERFNASGTMLARDARGSLQSRGLLDGHALDRINLLHAVVALVSFAGCVGLLWPLLAARLYRPAWLIGFVLAGLFANAFAGGALSGVFGRYQGRVVWLLPLAAVAAATILAEARAGRRRPLSAHDGSWGGHLGELELGDR